MKKRNSSNQNRNNTTAVIKFIQWANYEGGTGLMFIIFGMILILLFAVSLSIFNWCKLALLILGLGFIGFGLYLKKQDKK